MSIFVSYHVASSPESSTKGPKTCSPEGYPGGSPGGSPGASLGALPRCPPRRPPQQPQLKTGHVKSKYAACMQMYKDCTGTHMHTHIRTHTRTHTHTHAHTRTHTHTHHTDTHKHTHTHTHTHTPHRHTHIHHTDTHTYNYSMSVSLLLFTIGANTTITISAPLASGAERTGHTSPVRMGGGTAPTKQVIRVKKLVGLRPPTLELLVSYLVNQRMLCVHMNEMTLFLIYY